MELTMMRLLLFDNTDNSEKILYKKRWNSIALFSAVIIVTFLAADLLDFEFFVVFQRFDNAAVRFVKLYLPPNFKELNKMLDAIWVTIILSIASALMGVIIAYFSAIVTSRATGKSLLLRIVFRVIATFVRNVPASIWAVILLMAFWFGEFLALLVMTMATYGFLARVFSDMIDETNSKSIEALESTGASYWQIIAQSVFPETLPSAISWALYSFELNIRSATIIGMLAGAGIGFLTGYYKHFRRFDEMFAATFFIVITTLAADQISANIRKRLL
jgi:phosphonate transport system permease protein